MNRLANPRTLLVAASIALAVSVPTGAAAATGSRPGHLQAALDAVVAAGAPGAILLDRHGGRTTRLASGLADLETGRRMRSPTGSARPVR